MEEGEFDKDDSKYFQKLPKFENPKKEAIGEFLNEVQLTQRILYPYNILSLSVDFYDYGNALGQGCRFLYDNESFIPSFEIKRITYRDGEEVALTKDMYIDKKEILAKNAGFDTYEVSAIEDVLLESVYGSTTIALNDLRPVEKVEVAIVVKFLPSKLVYLKEEDDITLSDIFWWGCIRSKARQLFDFTLSSSPRWSATPLTLYTKTDVA